MKSRVIPAQITTVEDKIAGNLNFTQVILLMLPIFCTLIVYGMLPPILHFAWYKLWIIASFSMVCFTLAIRIKGKVLLNWLLIILRFNARPMYYVFNKNDSSSREIDLPVFEKKQIKVKRLLNKKEEKVVDEYISFGDLVRFQNLITNPEYSFSITRKKGGLNVSIKQVQK